MKIAFVNAPKREFSRSPFTGCKRMASLLPSSIFVYDDEIDYQSLRDEGYTIFCYGHTPRFYEHRKITKGCLTDIINSREEWLKTTIGVKCQSGFSYIKKRIHLYNCFFPTITTYKRPKEPSNVCVGYYARSIRLDTDREFQAFAATIPLEIPIVVMGDKIELSRPYIHTTDEDVFFSMCTHYFYMKSSLVEDPFPHTLLQACQCGCSLLLPHNERPWKDGIDDILDICDVTPIDTRAIKNPWELDRPCTFAPRGEDFIPLYNMISDGWNWLPKEQRTFSDVYNLALKI